MPTPSRPRRCAHLVGAVSALCFAGMAFAACSSTTGADAVVRLTIVQGNQQVAPVGTQLPLPVVLRVVGSGGAPVAQVPVQFAVQVGGGSVDPGTVISDANGEVRTKWTLGPSSTSQLLVGTARGADTVHVPAVGVPPRDLAVVQGNNQTARAGTLLPTAVVLRITGGSNLPMPNQTVTFTITAGGGSVTPQSAVTNSAGEVTLRWTLGPALGNQTVVATAGALSPVTIAAIAN